MMINKLKQKFKRKRNTQLQEAGFHGDKYLLALVAEIMKKVTTFIETGTNIGNTLHYVAKNYSHVSAFSCEPDLQAFKYAKKNLKPYQDRIKIYNNTSSEFITEIKQDHKELYNEPCLIWLDAHGYGFEWPLKSEIEFFTTQFNNAYILIDDFKVPNQEQFIYDQYQNQECSFEYIRSSIKCKEYQLFYPNYKERTSTFHPLKGWGLLTLNQTEIQIPADLSDKIIRQ
ncbi:MAG: hypothetical protein MJB14_00310 [Spirochaetes bacterium]|nr:hypothetical protein [Spirochaetota bacterium]